MTPPPDQTLGPVGSAPVSCAVLPGVIAVLHQTDSTGSRRHSRLGAQLESPMTSGVKVHLRPPPHVSFVSGYPGLLTEPPSSQACLKGTVEVRPTSSGKAVEASKLVLEIRKTECISTSKGIRRYFEVGHTDECRVK